MKSISVIISTYNSPRWLQKTLWSYENQTIRDFELLIADDGSTKDTRQLIQDYSRRVDFPVRHVWHEDNGFRKWKIVNRAIVEAEGDYLVFTDGDCVAHPQLLEVHRTLARPQCFLSGGYCRLPMKTSCAISKDHIDSKRAFRLHWLYRNGFSPSIKWTKIIVPGSPLEAVFNHLTPAGATFNGNNSSCFRKDALRVNGFDTRIGYGGGDREFGYRLAHSGIAPVIIRYSTLCLHLDHERAYKDPDVRDANDQIIEKTRLSRSLTNEYGIK